MSYTIALLLSLCWVVAVFSWGMVVARFWDWIADRYDIDDALAHGLGLLTALLVPLLAGAIYIDLFGMP